MSRSTLAIHRFSPLTVDHRKTITVLTRDVTIVSSIHISRPPQEVFDTGATPVTWPTWHPTATSVTGQVDRPVRAGDRILEQDRFAVLTGAIEWRVRAATPGRGWAIDGAVRGVPFADGSTVAITYVLTPTPAGTLVTRTMTYRPANAAAWLLDKLYLRRHNTTQSECAVQGLKRLLEDDRPALRRPG